MPVPQLFKADDGTVHEVVESKPVTLDELDQRIAESQSHTARLQELRDRVAAFSAVDSQPAQEDVAAAPAQPAAPEAAAAPAVAGTVDLEVIPAAQVQANADQGQSPVDPATQAPAADNAALNNGQVDPAAASNPTPGVETKPDAPALDANGNQVAAAPPQAAEPENSVPPFVA